MAERPCPKCKEPTWTQVGVCSACALSNSSGRGNAHLHESANNPHNRKMTYMDTKHITTRRVREDGMIWPDKKYK